MNAFKDVLSALTRSAHNLSQEISLQDCFSERKRGYRIFWAAQTRTTVDVPAKLPILLVLTDSG